ncbi:MAG: hypothetical protein A3F82_10905 [Deltaproteobacteria bacterium RIFCSPLOWO2_12_FULL_44_12]|nr:MAG: hypothetical protein A2712_08910 [Deltaproteobacteria bacterium RIFCSPHIGHO2_01_FULL_43_49]OGQ14543.1 MAG: hypothetical protein A3D22_08090 [Deltaproteobacteria bacterium RIFCSPHIGHO2_02_FULL_44_53]OGQ27929.1 MAG: hypothetical protein A3D98_06800 [Deltaproteobacteria bacterium RIFCSPHIGHO2_12_FULL_44_21]OGQ31141.1 MAG: hypothetical protein A2979_06850 [Deltaproteobacteria bacterium RIFCSPLOWO2_01_FULL_45_74]OGQ43133.1 MAG: hypothetical protein A3I70_00510 [Deltaproteobacteria bacterium 
MKKFSFLVLSSWFLVLIGCGHSSFLLEAPLDDTSPPLDQNDFSISQGEQTSTVREDRARLAEELESNPFTFPPPPQTLVESAPVNSLEAYVQAIVSFFPGTGAGFGQALLPEIVLGPPFGEGNFSGSVDVISLGNGGEIVLGFRNYIPIDGDGFDFIVFENAFFPQGGTNLFVEPAIVSVSIDGINFIAFPCTLTPPYDGCAGTKPVLANPDFNNIDPRDPLEAGGNPFDLNKIGLSYARFIKIRDAGLRLAGQTAQAGQSGFDLDAISIVHGAQP